MKIGKLLILQLLPLKTCLETEGIIILEMGFWPLPKAFSWSMKENETNIDKSFQVFELNLKARIALNSYVVVHAYQF